MENETQTKISPIRKMMMARLVAVQAEKRSLEAKLLEKKNEITEIKQYFKMAYLNKEENR